jgi:hypothetical protein
MHVLGITHMSAKETRHVFHTIDEVPRPSRACCLYGRLLCDATLRRGGQAHNNVISFDEFCHFFFPDLDIEYLVEHRDELGSTALKEQFEAHPPVLLQADDSSRASH